MRKGLMLEGRKGQEELRIDSTPSRVCNGHEQRGMRSAEERGYQALMLLLTFWIQLSRSWRFSTTLLEIRKQE
jgi:hypothetical protein